MRAFFLHRFYPSSSISVEVFENNGQTSLRSRSLPTTDSHSPSWRIGSLEPYQSLFSWLLTLVTDGMPPLMTAVPAKITGLKLTCLGAWERQMMVLICHSGNDAKSDPVTSCFLAHSPKKPHYYRAYQQHPGAFEIIAPGCRRNSSAYFSPFNWCNLPIKFSHHTTYLACVEQSLQPI